VQRQPDIALEREKRKRELQQRREAELEREREREQQRRKLLEAQKKREDELARRKQEQQKLAAETKRKEEDKKRKQQTEARDTKVREQIREEAMRRNAAMAGTGAPSSTGTAARSSGPSASWGGRVQARVRPNIVFTDDIGGNPKAEVEVRMAPDGTIIGKRLVRSSGVKAWDEAVLRALDKTEVLPRDVDGTVPGSVLIEFRPRG
jgi:colicin import membrane protein